MTTVLDASAILTLLFRESGASAVEEVLPSACVSAVNWSEVLQKLAQRRVDPGPAASALQALGLTIEPFTGDDAARTAQIWNVTHQGGLSLGDRACLALAYRLDAEAVTADRDWKGLDAGVRVRVIR